MREQEAEKQKLKHTYKDVKLEKKNKKTNCSGEGKRGRERKAGKYGNNEYDATVAREDE